MAFEEMESDDVAIERALFGNESRRATFHLLINSLMS